MSEREREREKEKVSFGGKTHDQIFQKPDLLLRHSQNSGDPAKSRSSELDKGKEKLGVRLNDRNRRGRKAKREVNFFSRSQTDRLNTHHRPTNINLKSLAHSDHHYNHTLPKTGERPTVNKVGNLRCFNLYVGNLPPRWSRTKIRMKFNIFGKVFQIFMPSKLNRAGKRFGFVRMGLETDINYAIHSLHNSFFDSFRVTVRHADSFAFEPKLQMPNEKMPSLRFIPNSAFQHIDKRSFSEVTKGDSKSIIPSISVQPRTENVEWLQRSLVGWLSTLHSPSVAAKKVKALTNLDVDLTYMGGKMFLLSCKTLVDCNFLYSKKTLLYPMFEEIKKWEQDDVGFSRLVSIRCTGIPLHIWGEDLFMKIGDIWGNSVSLDKSTVERVVLDSGRVLIRTGRLGSILGFVNINVGSKCYRISVTEEPFEGFVLSSQGFKEPVANELDSVVYSINKKVDTPVSGVLPPKPQVVLNSACHTPSQLLGSGDSKGMPLTTGVNGKLTGSSNSIHDQASLCGIKTCPVFCPNDNNKGIDHLGLDNMQDNMAVSADAGKVSESPLQFKSKHDRDEMAIKTGENRALVDPSLSATATEASKRDSKDQHGHLNLKNLQDNMALSPASGRTDFDHGSYRLSSGGDIQEVSALKYLSAPATRNLRSSRTKNLCVILKELSKKKRRNRRQVTGSPIASEVSSCKCPADNLQEEAEGDHISSGDIINRNKLLTDSAAPTIAACSEEEEICRIGVSLGVFDPNNANTLSLALRNIIDRDLGQA